MSLGPPTDKPAPEILAGVGISVSDLARSEDFYTRVLGMEVQQRIDLPHLREIIVGHAGRTSVVLMYWLDGRPTDVKGDNVKLVFFVPDAKAMIERIRSEGLTIQVDAELRPEFGNMIIGLAEDPDGYVEEFLQTT